MLVVCRQTHTHTLSFAIAENAAVGSAVGTASATDADGDSITYSISAGNGGGEFAIDAASGAITLAAALDYEKTTSHALTVTANDGNHAGTDTASVTVSVTDVLDTPPSAPTGTSATHSGGTFTVSWSAVSGADLYRASYRVRGAGGAWTNLPTTTGTTQTYAATVAASCGKTYEFRAEARGDGTSRLARWSAASDAASASGDACNNPPAFEKASYAFIALETLTGVGAVYATDADGETVSYAIASGDADGKFSITAETRNGRRQARLLATSPFDYETKSEYNLTVRATDTRGGSADASVRVLVKDVSENPPVALNSLSAAVSGTTITLSWDKPADDLITGYRLTRRAQGSEAVETIEIKGRASTTYADSSLSANTKYIYRVHAIDYFKRVGAATRTTATTGAAGG